MLQHHLLLALLVLSHTVLAKLLGDYGLSFMSVQRDGQAYAWGYNANGELGIGNTKNARFPVKMLGISQASDVTGGEYVNCVVDQGKVKCAGMQQYIGRGASKTIASKAIAVTGIPNGVTVFEVTASVSHVCARTSAGGALCWGSNEAGGLGRVASSYGPAAAVTGYSTNGVQAIYPGYLFTCILTVNNAVQCAGFNINGFLGRSNSDNATNTDMAPCSWCCGDGPNCLAFCWRVSRLCCKCEQ